MTGIIRSRANELTAGYDYAAFGHIHKAAQLIPNRVVMAGSWSRQTVMISAPTVSG